MPCPLFEPLTRLAGDSGRFPLIYEFAGVCHSDGLEHSSAWCNHGNAKGNCASFPDELAISAVRFDVTSRGAGVLTVLVVEEENHGPRTWSRFNFAVAGEGIEPEIQDVCRRAQVVQFCKSYLEKFKCQ